MLDGVTNGLRIVQKLGLEKFDNIAIQKVLNTAQSMFIITVNSRYTNLAITYSKIKKVKGTTFLQVNQHGESIETKNLKLTPPVDLYTSKISTSLKSIFIFRDIAGEPFMDDKMYEETKIKDWKKI